MQEHYLRPAVRALAGYVPGEQPQAERVIKLNTNENPYPPSPRVLEAVTAAVADGLRLYPDPQAAEVRTRAAACYGVSPGQVLVGNGSDEILGLIMRACVGPGTRVAYPVPTYSLYDTLVAIAEGVAVRVPYGPDWQLPEVLGDADATVTLVCHPNSPSGTPVAPEAIGCLARRMAERVDGLVVVDEAYADFADETALSLIGAHSNLAVLRSFSKSYSLAGMRVGLAIGPRVLIEALERVKDSYNVDRLSLVAAAAALDDRGWMEANVRRIRSTRARLADALRDLGFDVLPSAANFVFARRPGHNLAPLYAALRGQGILVRHFDTAELRDGLRITIGTEEETTALLEALVKVGR